MRVLLFNARRRSEAAVGNWPHLGLTVVATALKAAGHTPLVVDYCFTRSRPPDPAEFVASFRPDAVGLSIYTSAHDEAMHLATGIRRVFDGPMVAGGPHAALYADDLAADRRWAKVVAGEADLVAARAFEEALGGNGDSVITAAPPQGDRIPSPEFCLAFGHERMTWLPVQLSRGCPFGCSFCEVHKIASRRVRKRSVDAVLAEIRKAAETFIQLKAVRVVDDCPLADVPRFKRFLRGFLAMESGARLYIDNLRADQLDDETMHLLKQAGIYHVCFGVESGDPDVFRRIGKGESLQDIERACTLVRRHGVPLELCFVLGLPGATRRRDLRSLEFARRTGARAIYWNMVVPHRGTRVREWFARHGRLFPEMGASSLVDSNLQVALPVAETYDYPRRERARVWIRCVLETASFRFRLPLLPRMVLLAGRHRLWPSLAECFKTLSRQKRIFTLRRNSATDPLPRLERRAWRALVRRTTQQYPEAPSMALWRAHEAAVLSRQPIRPPVLDLGCGDGTFLASILGVEGAAGCDLDKHALRRARRLGTYSALLPANAAALPFADGQFRTVLANCSLEHVADLDAALREARRVLAPGGNLMLTVPLPELTDLFLSLSTLLASRSQRARFIERYHRDRDHKHILSLADWEGRLQDAGLAVVERRAIVPPWAARAFTLIDSASRARLPGFRGDGMLQLLLTLKRAGFGPAMSVLQYHVLKFCAATPALAKGAGAFLRGTHAVQGIQKGDTRDG